MTFPIEYASTLQKKNFLLTSVFTINNIKRRFCPSTAPRQKRDRTTTKEWEKHCNLQLACILVGRRLWPPIHVKYPGHNNSTRVTQADLQLACVIVINVRCLYKLPIITPEETRFILQDKQARVQEILS